MSRVTSRERTDVRGVLAAHRAEFLSYLSQRLGRRDLAEDIFQDAFARALEKIDTLRVDEAVVGWFYRVLRNAVIDHFRRSKTVERALARFAEEIEQEEPAREVAAGTACPCVGRLAAELKPEYAVALRRIEVDELPVTRFAEEQGISSGNAGVRVYRAREALRRQVQATCGTCAEAGCLACTCAEPREDAKGGGAH